MRRAVQVSHHRHLGAPYLAERTVRRTHPAPPNLSSLRPVIPGAAGRVLAVPRQPKEPANLDPPYLHTVPTSPAWPILSQPHRVSVRYPSRQRTTVVSPPQTGMAPGTLPAFATGWALLFFRKREPLHHAIHVPGPRNSSGPTLSPSSSTRKASSPNRSFPMPKSSTTSASIDDPVACAGARTASATFLVGIEDGAAFECLAERPRISARKLSI